MSGENLFVANYWGNSVGKYNALTGATVNASFVSGIANPKGLAVKGNLLYVTIGSYYGDDTVRTYDIATGASINNAFITNAGSANCLQIIGNMLYVAQSEHGRIAKFDATTGALIDAEWITGVTDGAFAIAYSAPRITSQPQSLTVYAGQEASFTVSATGTDVLAYQWRKNGVDIANATGSIFTLSNVNYRDAGDYVVEVTDGLSPVDSGTARLTVISPAPNVSITPGDTQVEAGQNLTFTATVNAGIPPFTYQWRKDGKPIAKATSDTLSLTNLQPKQAGVYDVVVKNAFGVAVSNATRLSFAPPASIVKAPQNNDVDSGGTAVFTVDVPGATAWQWLKNGVPIKGAISSTLTVEDVDVSDAGLYSVIVTTPDGKVTTVPAQLCLNDSGLLIYKLAGTGKTYEGAVSAKAVLSGYLVLDRAGQRGGLILGGKNGNLKIHRVQLHEDLHTQSTGPVPKTQTVVSEMLADELALWLNGTDSLLKINKTDMAVGPVALKGFANSIDAGSTLQLETVNLTLMLDAANSATARLFQETVEQALARISQDLQAKGSALVE